MPYISQKEWDSYLEYRKLKLNGFILTPNGLRLICKTYSNDAEAIGRHMLSCLARINEKEKKL